MGPFGSHHGEFDLRAFTKAFVAALVLKDLYEVRPDDSQTRRGFNEVVRVLDEALGRLQETHADAGFIRRVRRVVNELRPSNTGAFDGFETALRKVQLTFTSSPNPDYDDIVFSVPKMYAQAAVDHLPADQKRIVEDAARVFFEEVDAP